MGGYWPSWTLAGASVAGLPLLSYHTLVLQQSWERFVLQHLNPQSWHLKRPSLPGLCNTSRPRRDHRYFCPCTEQPPPALSWVEDLEGKQRFLWCRAPSSETQHVLSSPQRATETETASVQTDKNKCSNLPSTQRQLRLQD